jgi:selenocysteine-specific elongation factor
MHVIATAGHVDHGKSTLVRALTGMEPDRWAEERRRGMTIDLGYAWTALPSGEQVAFVDVPGHAKFVANMLAGIGPVPAVMVVVAADEGWRQQSEEHLAAVDALAVRHGLLVVTRSDLLDPSLALAEARERIARTTLGEVEAVAVSGVTGAGLEELRAALDRLVGALPAPRVDGDVRLWVDRAFTIRGSGTVVTGTLGAGTLHVGDELELAPGGARVRVRGLESLKRHADAVAAVARVAVNLRGVGVEDVSRGQALVTPGAWPVTAEVDVRISSDSRDVPAEQLLHVGSSAVTVHLRPLGADTARLRLARPLPLRPGDRALLRDPGRHLVTAGLTVLDPRPPALRRRGAATERAAVLAGVGDSPDAAGEVLRRGALRRADLLATGAGDPGDAVVAVGEWYVAPWQWQAWQRALREAVATHAAAHPLEAGLPVEAARRALGAPDVRIVDAVVFGDDTLESSAGRIRARGTASALPPALEGPVAELTNRLRADPFAAPEAGDLAALGLSPQMLAAACRAGRLLRVAEGIYLLPDAVDEAVCRLAELPQPFTASQARQALGTTRRVAIPLLEHLDAQGRTHRLEGAVRTVLPG